MKQEVCKKLSDYNVEMIEEIDDTTLAEGVTGLRAEISGMCVMPCIYADLGAFTEKWGMPAVVDKLSSEFITAIENAAKLDIEDFSADKVYQGAFLSAENYEYIRNAKDRYIYRRYLDMAIAVRCRIDKDLVYSFSVGKDMAKALGIDEDELFERAYQNTLNQFGVNMNTLEFFTGLTIITNDMLSYGASFIYFPEVLDSLYQRFGRNFYIIPSSVDEILAFPENSQLDKEDMLATIYAVNRDLLDRNKILSDNLYYYDSEFHELNIVEI